MFDNFYNDVEVAWFYLRSDYLELLPNAPSDYDGLILMDANDGCLDFRLNLRMLGERYFNGDVLVERLIKDAINVNVKECLNLEAYYSLASKKMLDEYELVSKYVIRYDSQVDAISNPKTRFKSLISTLRSIYSDKDKDELIRLDIFPLSGYIEYNSKLRHYNAYFRKESVSKPLI